MLRMCPAWVELINGFHLHQKSMSEQIVEVGTEEDNTCNRDGCQGKMEFPEVENCSCHIAPPCSACVDNPLTCNECGQTPEDNR